MWKSTKKGLKPIYRLWYQFIRFLRSIITSLFFMYGRKSEFIRNQHIIETVKKARVAGCSIRHPLNWGYVDHLDFFFSKKCASSIMHTQLFPNAKEISESVGLWRAATKHFELDTQSFGITCLCVGDGCSPRLGVLCAFFTKWHVLSIDPELHTKYIPQIKDVDRFFCFQQKIEDFLGEEKKKENKTITAVIPWETTTTLLVMGQHAHVHFEKVVHQLKSQMDRHSCRLRLAIMPCCVRHSLPWTPHKDFEDLSIFSDKRRILLFQI